MRSCMFCRRASFIKDSRLLYPGQAENPASGILFFIHLLCPERAPILFRLLLKHFRIPAAFCQQLLMCSLLYDSALFHHIDPFRHAGCGQAVGYEDNRPTSRQFKQRPVEVVFRDGIQRAGRLVHKIGSSPENPINIGLNGMPKCVPCSFFLF